MPEDHVAYNLWCLLQLKDELASQQIRYDVLAMVLGLDESPLAWIDREIERCKQIILDFPLSR